MQQTRRPEGGWGWSEEPDGSHLLRNFRGLDLDPLVADLTAFRDAVVVLEQTCFEYSCPDLVASAELIGGQRLTAAQWFVTGFKPMRARDGVLRYDRDRLLQAARMVDANWRTPFSEPQPQLPDA